MKIRLRRIDKLAKSGAFKIIRIGNMIRISRKSFEDWLGMEEAAGENLRLFCVQKLFSK